MSFVTHGEVAALATRHEKERVLAGPLRDALGLRVEVSGSVDTDGFGTFTRDVPRKGTALETARAKARAALAAHDRARFGLASEGSFGPHPSLPFVAGGVELVLLLDSQTGIEVTGMDVTAVTNYASQAVRSVDEGVAFATSAWFPSHGMIVIAAPQGAPEPTLGMTKGIDDRAALEAALRDTLGAHGGAWLETDMRAHKNPTRMRAIERAVHDLIAAVRSACPACARPGFVVAERLRGLPCDDCGAPTQRARAEVRRCTGCNLEHVTPLPGKASAFDCPQCNP